eukprot:11730157-Prorocentrum_lima.AAC.1
MTSSLVGSEMCIRDRFEAAEKQSLVHPSKKWSTGMAMLLVTRAAAKAPVSYTHLTLPTICSV